MNKSLIKESRSVAFIYGCFSMVNLSYIIITLIFARRYGISLIDALKATSGTMLYLIILALINGIMAIAVWKFLSLSKKLRQATMGITFFFVVAAVTTLITAILSWFPQKMPSWYSPFYNVFPAGFLTFGYAYIAYMLVRINKKSLTPPSTQTRV